MNRANTNLGQLRESFRAVTDRLGQPIEDAIFDLVVILNALKIPTVASCGGHENQGHEACPWISIYPDFPTDETKWWQDPVALAKFTSESHLYYDHVAKLLVDFYHDRSVPNEQQITLEKEGEVGGFVLVCRFCIPNDNRFARPSDPEKLANSRAEFSIFTTFLTNLYLKQASE